MLAFVVPCQARLGLDGRGGRIGKHVLRARACAPHLDNGLVCAQDDADAWCAHVCGRTYTDGHAHGFACGVDGARRQLKPYRYSCTVYK